MVTTTIDSPDAADALAKAAVTVRLAACAQVVGPVRSAYWWEGAVEEAEEWVVTLKTTTQWVRRTGALHPRRSIPTRSPRSWPSPSSPATPRTSPG